MKKYHALLLFFFVLSACRLTQGFSLVSTPTPTPTLPPTFTLTPTTTFTPTVTPTKTPLPPTPTVTPIPLTIGQWKGVADGWNPPLTVSFKLSEEGNMYSLENIVVFIPNIDLSSYMTSIRCTLQVESLTVADNAFVFHLGGYKVFDGQFTSPTSIAGNIYGGWACDGKTANFGGEGHYVPWHAEARE